MKSLKILRKTDTVRLRRQYGGNEKIANGTRKPAGREGKTAKMKFVWIIGDPAVGKMTVGQELMKITDLRLFHNHMTIEPVMAVFGAYNSRITRRVRDVIFQEFAASELYGMIFTFLWAFDDPEDWNYVDHVRSIFEPYGTEFYCVELTASEEIRLQRNVTENRLVNKPSKQNIERSEKWMREEALRSRTVSHDGELPFENYLRIDNSDKSPELVARMIRDHFGL